MNYKSFLFGVITGFVCLSFSCTSPSNNQSKEKQEPTVAVSPSHTPPNEEKELEDVMKKEPNVIPVAEIQKTEPKPDSPKPQKPDPKTKSPASAKTTTTQAEIPASTQVETPPVKPEVPKEEAKEEVKTKVDETPKPVAFSHDTWDDLLKKHVSSSGTVNYKGFIQDKAKHQTYLDLLSNNTPQNNWSRNQKLAYWINAYNAFTVKLIVDNYPLKSIQDLGKPWDKSFIKLGGSTYTLNQIENEIIRPQFNEPRIHFAVNCAAKSCPRLMNGAFQPESLNSQLEKMTKTFIRNEAFNQISEKKVTLSKIFDWYGGDFTKSGTLIDFINKYAITKAEENAKVDFLEYNWKLNE